MVVQIVCIVSYYHSCLTSTAYSYVFVGSSEVKMSEQDQSDERRPLLQATPAGAEPPSSISLDALQRLLESQLSRANSRFSSMVEDKLQSFKREMSEDNASLLESAFKRLKKDSYTFKAKAIRDSMNTKKKYWNPSVKLRRVSPPIGSRKLQRRSNKV